VTLFSSFPELLYTPLKGFGVIWWEEASALRPPFNHLLLSPNS
jgi:hypothetical protein